MVEMRLFNSFHRVAIVIMIMKDIAEKRRRKIHKKNKVRNTKIRGRLNR